jgi:hypothetical protein
MYRRIIFIILCVSLVLPSGIFASTVKTKVGNVVVESGPSSREIRPFLEKIASTWGKYLKRVYGVYRDDQILINIKIKQLNFTSNEISKMGNNIARELAVTYPLSAATLIISVPANDETFHKLQWEIDNGEIIGYSDSDSKN